MNRTVHGWGRQPRLQADVDTPRDLQSVRDLLQQGHVTIARGAGRSYGDAATASRVLSCLSLNHLLAFDESTGILQAQGGVTLDEIIRFCLPRGWFLPVTPGTKFPTLAGCVAADVHGKNHHGAGGLSASIEQLKIILADGTMVTCSRGSHADLFWATLGGMGLTGVIYAIDLRLQRVQSAFLDNVSIRTSSLAETCSVLCATQDEFPYSVAWIDTLRQRGRGAGHVMLGSHAKDRQLEPVHQAPRLSVPELPLGLVIRPGLRLFNICNYRRQWRRRVRSRIHYDPYFYPLDAVAGWNRLYGPHGFLQFQFVVPFADAEAVISSILQATNRAAPCALAVLKTFGDHPTGPLGFPMPGFTLALDFPRSQTIEDAIHNATNDVIAAGGRIYLAKDSVLTKDQFDAMYPRLDEFRRLRQQVDPTQRFRSRQSDRLGLT
jgi:decaprenylphospho-beta-D-ribofuranose 2-oxidase